MGLTIVKKIVNLQKGEISLKSKVGTGTTFIIDLPFEKSTLETQSLQYDIINSELNNVLPYPKGIKVLMAEDNEMNQELSKVVFKELGWDLDIADNGVVVIDKLKKNVYDIILMDIQMPVMDGYEATLKIRNEFSKPESEIPIMAITAHALNSEINKCLAAGMNDYLSKPFKTNDLIAKVGVLLPEKFNSISDPDLIETDFIIKNQSKGNENIATGLAKKTKSEDENRLKYQVDDIPENLIDLNNLMELSGNNYDTVNDIMDIFIKQNPKRLEELQEYFVKNDWASLKSLCHKMKSSYSIIGSFEVKNMLEMIEVECSKKNVDIEKFSGQIERIIMLNEKILKEIKMISVK